VLGASCFEEPKRHNLHHVVKHLSFRCLHSPLATIVSAFAMIPWVGAWFVSPFSVVVVNKVGVFLIKSFLPPVFMTEFRYQYYQIQTASFVSSAVPRQSLTCRIWRVFIKSDRHTLMDCCITFILSCPPILLLLTLKRITRHAEVE